VATPVLLAVVKAVMPLRVPLADELGGIDGVEHSEEAYHGGGLAEFAAPALTLSQRVVLPAEEFYGARPEPRPVTGS
jgi:hypothetical protein